METNVVLVDAFVDVEFIDGSYSLFRFLTNESNMDCSTDFKLSDLTQQFIYVSDRELMQNLNNQIADYFTQRFDGIENLTATYNSKNLISGEEFTSDFFDITYRKKVNTNRKKVELDF